MDDANVGTYTHSELSRYERELTDHNTGRLAAAVEARHLSTLPGLPIQVRRSLRVMARLVELQAGDA
jgi:hypothetical protein